MVAALEQRRIGKYEVLAPLSVGGMAEVFLAYLPGPGGFRKFVAVKQILAQERSDDQFVKLFLDEARITAALSHPNIGQVFELGRDETTQELFLAMEFIAGQTLSAVLNAVSKAGEQLAPEVACRLARDACLALHAAHSFVDPSGRPLPIVHRDVSPKNVMLSYDGHVKVIDFGIAKARGRLARTDAGLVRGTISYMSPEQLFDEPLDGRSDQFSMGIVLYELLTSRHLYSSGPKAALEIAEDAPQAPSKSNPAVSPELDAIVLRALSKDKESRFESCKAMARAIEAACPRLANEDELAAVLKRHFGKQLEASRQLLLAAGTATGVTQELTGLAAAAQVVTKPSVPRAAPTERDLPPPRPAARGRSIAIGVSLAALAIIAITAASWPRSSAVVAPLNDPLPEALRRSALCFGSTARGFFDPAAGSLPVMLEVDPSGSATPVLDDALPETLRSCLRVTLSVQLPNRTEQPWKQLVRIDYPAASSGTRLDPTWVARWKDEKRVTVTLDDMKMIMKIDTERAVFRNAVLDLDAKCQNAMTLGELQTCSDELSRLAAKFYR